MKYIIVLGNPVRGLAFVGPFDTHQETLDYAESRRFDEWWIATMLKQEVEA